MGEVDLTAHVTLLDLAQETMNKKFIDVAKVLTKKVPIFQDAHWEEANMKAAHRFGRDVALASGGMRAINDGIDASKGEVGQFEEPVGLYEDRSEIDEELVRLAPNPLEFRYRKDNQHIGGAANWLGQQFLYAVRNAANPNGITGFEDRYDALSLDNVHDNGDASADAVTSAYIINWGPEKVSFLYPRNGKVDADIIERKDMGLQLLPGANSKNLWKWVTEFYFRYGIYVMDDKYLQRIANIGTAAANNFDVDKGIDALSEMEDTEGAVMYVNKKVYAQLSKAAKNMGDHIVHWLKYNDIGWVLMFQDIPVRKWPSIKLTEAVVT